MHKIIEVEFGLVIGKDEIPITKNQLKINDDLNMELALTEIINLMSDDYITNTYYLDIYDSDQNLEMCFVIEDKSDSPMVDMIYSIKPELNFVQTIIQKIVKEKPSLV